MNPEEATDKFLQWGVLLLLDSPKGLEFGIDNTIWKTGTKFKGVKLIPFGAHFAHYTLGSENNQFKLGFFFFVSSKKRVFVRRWNQENDDFLPINSGDEEQRYIQGVDSFQFDQFLGPYPMERVPIWLECSNYITEEVIDSLSPIEKRIGCIEQEYKQNDQEQNSSSQQQEKQIQTLVEDFLKMQTPQCQKQEEESEKIQLQTQSKLQQIQSMLNGNTISTSQEEVGGVKDEEIQEESKIEEEEEEDVENNKPTNKKDNKVIGTEDFRVMAGTIYYSYIPKMKNIATNKKPEEITAINLDRTSVLKSYIEKREKIATEQILRKKYKITKEEQSKVMAASKSFIFGEFQYSFIMLLLGEDFDSLEHWKNIMSLLLGSDSYMEQDCNFFIDLIPVLYNQLKQLPKDFFIDAITKDSFLKTLLSSFIEVSLQSNSKKLQTRITKLQSLLQDHFLFFPTKVLLQNEETGQYFYDAQDEDAPQIVDEQNINYF